jgi:cytoskeletal protein CcmA (bactofilin family)
MWKKDEEIKTPNSPSGNTSATTPPERPARQPRPPSGQQATIGRSISIKGDVTGDEDLVIEGRIEGKVDLKQHNITIGPEGRVKADVVGRTVTIEGSVEGDVRGQEQVALRSSSKVTGDIVAPRVVLEDGATFLGSIDMTGKPDGAAAPRSAAAAPTSPTAPKPPETETTSTAAAKG